MSAVLERAKLRFLQDRNAAYAAAAERLCSILGVQFQVMDWSNRALEAIADQWGDQRHADANWDWKEIIRRHKEPDWLPMVTWIGNGRLAGIALGLTKGQAVELRFLEGDPRGDCPLKGKRALVALEVAACYAQARGKAELRVMPVNSSLESLYRDVYGFELVSKHGQQQYYRKRV